MRIYVKFYTYAHTTVMVKGYDCNVHALFCINE